MEYIIHICGSHLNTNLYKLFIIVILDLTDKRL